MKPIRKQHAAEAARVVAALAAKQPGQRAKRARRMAETMRREPERISRARKRSGAAAERSSPRGYEGRCNHGSVLYHPCPEWEYERETRLYRHFLSGCFRCSPCSWQGEREKRRGLQGLTAPKLTGPCLRKKGMMPVRKQVLIREGAALWAALGGFLFGVPDPRRST